MSYAPPAIVNPHLLQRQIPDAMRLSLRLEHEGHSFFAFIVRWMFE